VEASSTIRPRAGFTVVIELEEKAALGFVTERASSGAGGVSPPMPIGIDLQTDLLALLEIDVVTEGFTESLRNL